MSSTAATHSVGMPPRTAEAGRSAVGEREQRGAYVRKINLIYRPVQDGNAEDSQNHLTPSPAGWESYDGSIYTPERGYGWLTDLRGYGRDRGTHGIVVLTDGTRTSPQQLNRPELANFHSRHVENWILVFRIDLPDGWYRVSCVSVDPGTPKPLIDQRSFKCRAHDVVFAGANYGAPIVVSGEHLIESSGIVEVTDGHLRIVVGDPSYAGWTWTHPGPWYTGLKYWWRIGHTYANGWYQWLTRTVDPGFHSLGMNSLEVERVPAPVTRANLVFRDFFNRNDNSDVNAGVESANRWIPATHLTEVDDAVHVGERQGQKPGRLLSHSSGSLRSELHHTAITFSGGKAGLATRALLQQRLSPSKGIIRYSTRVSLFTGEGSQKNSGMQEAGVVLLADPAAPGEFNVTFVGVQFDSRRTETKGRLIYRVGNGQERYRVNTEIADTRLPFKITEGEYEIVAEHDVKKNVLRRIQVNGVDVTDHWSVQDRTQRIPRGLFGIRSAIHNTNARANLQQFYWYYRVEAVSEKQVED